MLKVVVERERETVRETERKRDIERERIIISKAEICESILNWRWRDRKIDRGRERDTER